MTEADQKQLESIRRRVERFQLGKSMQQIFDLKFLLSKIDELRAELAKEKSK